MEGFLTVREAAVKAKVAQGSVYRWLDDPEVPLTRHKTGNRRVLINEAELDAWIRLRNTPIIVSVPAASPVVTGVAS